MMTMVQEAPSTSTAGGTGDMGAGLASRISLEEFDALLARQSARYSALQCAAIWIGVAGLGWASFVGAGYGIAGLLKAAF